MKFSDIPKFTKIPNYHVSVSVDYLEYSLARYEEEYDLQMCPDFQRGHVWTEQQQILFVEFFLKGGVSGKTIYLNCPGWMRSFRREMVLVDGLQRLTAVIKFINNELTAFGHYFKDFEGRLPTDVYFDFYIHDLTTRAEVLQWYIDLNEGGVVHSQDEIARVKKLLEKETVK